MRAIQVTEHGGSDRLQLAELPDPAPGPGEVLVAVEAAGINFVEVYVRTGLYPSALPYVPGGEAAGRVVAVGPGVDSLAVGDRVASVGCAGSYAELTTVAAAAAVRIPDEVGTDVAGALMLQGMTAHYLSHSTYPLTPGDVCLVHAAAGGVGRLLVQMAKMAGATVVGTVGTAEKEDLARSAGADHVIRYRDVDFADTARDLLGEQPFDVVYDSVGKDTFLAGLGLLKLRGTMVLYGQASGPVEPLDLRLLNVKGSLFVTRPTLYHYIADRAELEKRSSDLFAWTAAGDLEVRIDTVFPLGQAAAAHDHIEARATTGKLLLAPGA